MRRYILAFLFIVLTGVLLFNCGGQKAKSPFRNINKEEEAHYEGMSECRNCHEPIYKTYMQTGMGQSWGLATKDKSSADFSAKHAPIYDKNLDLYYKAFWKGEELYIKEYRLYKGDTSHYREEKISYVVGSGQHTNSHIIDMNGYLHQAPITFYTQKGKWDLAPGYEDGQNMRFSRKIQTECITCHNGYPEHIEGSLNKYAEVKQGIDCERCHGPGSIHVAEKKVGKIIDTSKGPDYSIVNPKRLTTEQQNNLCQRCHLQGIAVLNDGKNFFDFLPTQELKNTMSVFMPSFSGIQKHMIMASHVERMKMSNCYVNSGKMSCITCHNPHISIEATPVAQYNTACKSCHNTSNTCTEKLSVRQSKNDNCSSCHMAKNESIDIPHVAVTDHFIRRTPTIENEEAIRKFIGLTSYNNENPSKRIQARAFLEFYERYEPNPLLLDTALEYLSNGNNGSLDKDVLRTYFLKKDYKKIIELSAKEKPATINDAWTAYRIGESQFQGGDVKSAILYHKQAVKLMPYGLDFRMKLINALIKNENLSEAKVELTFILKENDRYEEAHKALGYIYLTENKLDASIKSTEKAIALNPINEQAYINLAVANYKLNRLEKVKQTLKKASRLYPANEQIKAMLNDIQ